MAGDEQRAGELEVERFDTPVGQDKAAVEQFRGHLVAADVQRGGARQLEPVGGALGRVAGDEPARQLVQVQLGAEDVEIARELQVHLEQLQAIGHQAAGADELEVERLAAEDGLPLGVLDPLLVLLKRQHLEPLDQELEPGGAEVDAGVLALQEQHQVAEDILDGGGVRVGLELVAGLHGEVMREGGRLGVIDAGEELGVAAILGGADGGLAAVGGALELKLHLGAVLPPQRDGVVALVVGHHHQGLAVGCGDSLAVLVQHQQLGAGGPALVGFTLVVLVGVDEQLPGQRRVGVLGVEVRHGGDGLGPARDCDDGGAGDRQAIFGQVEADLVAALGHIKEVVLAGRVGEGVRLLQRVADAVIVGIAVGLAGIENPIVVGVFEGLWPVEHAVVVGVEVDAQPLVRHGRADFVGDQGFAGELHRRGEAVETTEAGRVDVVVDLQVGPLGCGGHPLLAPGHGAGAALQILQREVGGGVPNGAIGIGQRRGAALAQRGQLGAGVDRVILAAVDGTLGGLHLPHIARQGGQFQHSGGDRPGWQGGHLARGDSLVRAEGLVVVVCLAGGVLELLFLREAGRDESSGEDFPCGAATGLR